MNASLAPQCGIWISTFPFAYFYAAKPAMIMRCLMACWKRS
jgi:hypothetical protein